MLKFVDSPLIIDSNRLFKRFTGTLGTEPANQILPHAARTQRTQMNGSDTFIACLEKAASDLQVIEHRLEAEFSDRYSQEARHG